MSTHDALETESATLLGDARSVTEPSGAVESARAVTTWRQRRFPGLDDPPVATAARRAADGVCEGEPGRTLSDSSWLLAAKRLADIVFATALVVLLAPLLIAIAIAIRLDSPGPALFRQRRVGHRHREFTLFKFRSMRLDADPRGHRDYVTALIKNDGAAPNGGRENLYKLAVDDRITSVGRRIRKWSLDELPQLFNVIAGDMTLVGPRPAIPYEVAEYPTWYLRRFEVKPGLTGLWQVSGRNERTYEEMVSIDIEYTERRSLLLDISILARTPWAVLSRRGAS